MIGDAEGGGEAVSPEIVPRRIEPEHGEPEKTGGLCRNCHSELQGEYCHHCGQRAHIHRSLAAIGHDLAHSVAHFEGKTWHTLPLLVWRPGELTRRYIDGERTRFVSPMALFLFSVFLMFAVFSAIGSGSLAPEVQSGPEAQAEFAAGREAAEQEIRTLERQRATRAAQGQDTRAVDEQLADARRELRALSAVAELAGSGGGDAFRTDVGPGGQGWFSAAYRKAKENPSLLAYKLQANAYKFSWALIPISIPFLWLLFAFRREFKTYDHAIFVTYSISFMTLLAVTLSLLLAIGLPGGWFALALVVIPPLHMYRQLRGAYRLSPASAAWRAVLLALFALVSGTAFLFLLIGIGIS